MFRDRKFVMIALNARGASFSLLITVDTKGQYELPGSRAHWPEDVKVDGQPKAVLEGERAPLVDLAPGSHTVTGRFVWKRVPDSLQMPSDLGSLSLKVKGSQIAFPKREADGLVWLESSRGGAAEEEHQRPAEEEDQEPLS